MTIWTERQPGRRCGESRVVWIVDAAVMPVCGDRHMYRANELARQEKPKRGAFVRKIRPLNTAHFEWRYNGRNRQDWLDVLESWERDLPF